MALYYLEKGTHEIEALIAIGTLTTVLPVFGHVFVPMTEAIVQIVLVVVMTRVETLLPWSVQLAEAV